MWHDFPTVRAVMDRAGFTDADLAAAIGQSDARGLEGWRHGAMDRAAGVQATGRAGPASTAHPQASHAEPVWPAMTSHQLRVDIDVDELAQAVAVRVAALISSRQPPAPEPGYLAPAEAARYLGVTRKRVYDLRSTGALVPDGFDGRTPWFTCATLDAYVRGTSNGAKLRARSRASRG